MTRYEIYVFFLCLIVFTALTALFSILLTLVVKQGIRLIRCGEEDEEITKEFEKNRDKKGWVTVVDRVLSALLCLVLLVAFAFSVYVKAVDDNYLENVPTLKVVNSGSMAKKMDTNTYLFENDLNDQIQTFDLILTYQIPDEYELELYDIVVYEVEDTLLVHRIVGIEEPNERHPNERWFTCQGDAVERPDRFPVHYWQMKGIYRGERIAFIGSFVFFMQSPAGWLCALLVLFAMIATPIVEKKIKNEKLLRLSALEVRSSSPAKKEERV